LGVDVRVVLAKDLVELGHGAGSLDPGRATADHDHVQRTVLDELRVAVRRLPALEHVILEPHRIRERVERKRVLGRPVHAEEVDLRAERENEVVVSLRRELVEADLARLQVDSSHPVLVDADVVLLVEEVADRMADRGLLEQARRDLVKQRLERVVVVPIHEHDVDVALAQLPGGADPAESSA
jgi:hypothetical protein